MTNILPRQSSKRSITIQLAFFLVLLLLSGCAGIAGRGRMDAFSRISKAYEWALESANYRGAAGYLDPSVQRPPIDFKRYANIKVADYTITRSKASDDKRMVRQDVEIQYFLLDRSIVRTTMDHQVWRYSETEKKWRLQTGLPDLPQK